MHPCSVALEKRQQNVQCHFGVEQPVVLLELHQSMWRLRDCGGADR